MCRHISWSLSLSLNIFTCDLYTQLTAVFIKQDFHVLTLHHPMRRLFFPVQISSLLTYGAHTKLFAQVQMVPRLLWPEALQWGHEARLQKISLGSLANHSAFMCQYHIFNKYKKAFPSCCKVAVRICKVLSAQNLWQRDSCRHTEDNNRQFLAATSVRFLSTLQKKAENQTEDILFHSGYLEQQQSKMLCWGCLSLTCQNDSKCQEKGQLPRNVPLDWQVWACSM